MRTRSEIEDKIKGMMGVGFGTGESVYWKLQFELLLDIRDLLIDSYEFRR